MLTRPSLSRVRALARLDLVFVLFLFAICVVQAAIYIDYPINPFTHATGGWERWSDQSQYLKSARALAVGDLDASNHWYPLGYPLLGAPFAALGARDPFVLPNLAAILVFAGAYLAFFRSLIGAPAAVIAFFGAMLLPVEWLTPYEVRHLVWLQFVIPWSTTPVAAMFMSMVLLLKGLRERDALWKDALLGALAAAVVATRPVEALAMLPLGIFYLYRRLVPTRSVVSIGAAVGGATLVIVPVALLMFAIYGSLSTPYMQAASSLGLSALSIPERAFAIFVDAGRSFGEPTSALFSIFPWLIVLGPLAVFAAIMRPLVLGPAVALAGASALTYLSFNDFSPVNIVRFHLIHYLTWMLPVVASAGIAGAILMVRHPAAGTAAAFGVAVVAAISALRIAPTPVAGVRTTELNSLDGAVTYALSIPPSITVHALDIRNYASDPGIGGGNPLGVMVNREPMELTTGYRILFLPDRVRVIFNRSVTPGMIWIRLKDGETGRFTSPGSIEAVTFRLALATPWAPHLTTP